jgi:hypothetical protein
MDVKVTFTSENYNYKVTKSILYKYLCGYVLFFLGKYLGVDWLDFYKYVQ